ncbi:branched-chain amino acid ABC transporter permease [Magnetospirillum fulvum]|uniref:Amino acid/amide ABC transporter membrane protein 2, HAAT family n=1 Tax=Magnetospirillum fulvum TaxID=1082 RepID=A0A1H6JCU9_MAGFU|nr:branched-chain amino acid ABC transporter permease [Magnetospirillum fulvum]SEH58554.1 amino acid/amide ABC transporter membrane protein 2, HAAT family [Magnetospirillum fulvum]
MIGSSLVPCGQFKTSYSEDTTLFLTPASRRFCIAAIVLAAAAPLVLGPYPLTLMIQIGFFAIAALGLNILVGSTGQISLGHAAFFGFGAFASAWLNSTVGVPVLLAIPLAGLMTTLLGLLFGIPAGRLKGLYLAIATFASQYILEDFFARATWFTGGSSGAMAAPASLFGWELSGDRQYFYVVLVFLVVMFVLGANLLRTRDGRAFVAVRDHYLSAEVMGVNLTRYRILSFGISSFYAGIGGALYGHYLGYVSAEGFTILQSIQFLGMIIIGGLGSVTGTLMGTCFMVLLPEVTEGAVSLIKQVVGDVPGLTGALAYIKEAAIGLAIVLFLIFEPDGLVHRWRTIKSYWKLYPFSY